MLIESLRDHQVTAWYQFLSGICIDEGAAAFGCASPASFVVKVLSSFLFRRWMSWVHALIWIALMDCRNVRLQQYGRVRDWRRPGLCLQFPYFTHTKLQALSRHSLPAFKDTNGCPGGAVGLAYYSSREAMTDQFRYHAI